MGLDDILNLEKDYILEDFKKESYKNRLEILSKSVNLIPRAILHTCLSYGKVYTNEIELFDEFLRCLGISYKEFQRNKRLYRGLMPINPSTYWGYVSLNSKGEGPMVRIGLLKRVQITPESYGYTLTPFGEYMKPFVSYILKKCAELDIDPWELFGQISGREGKRPSINSIEILKYIYEGGEVSVGKIARATYMSSGSLNSCLKRFEKLGLIEYKNPFNRNKIPKAYRVNKEKIRDTLECLENPECKKEVIRVYRYIPYRMAKKVLEYLKNKSEGVSDCKGIFKVA